jgi:hypothetical protein
MWMVMKRSWAQHLICLLVRQGHTGEVSPNTQQLNIARIPIAEFQLLGAA